MIETVVILAAGASTNGVDLTSLFQYGVLGVVVILLILGKVVPWSYYDEKKAQIEKLEAQVAAKDAVIAQKDKDIDTVRSAKDEEIKALRTAIEDKIIPLAIRLLDVVDRPRRTTSR